MAVDPVSGDAPAGQAWVKVSARGMALEQREQVSLFAVVPTAALKGGLEK